ncbi:ABC transporter ATP-binding protein [Bacillus swezeyi]|uniref:ATP-binding cassette domain-containing protein n=1 Tax=Bacillus swezeyi TaxID=1925020 RepID=A0A5M8RML3_9BACI|nr:ABC transporter ATP-binding protein [Bacillus swezeyi]KAA6449339.1 ATP-binding cassette domain-containing protein [Bacillus swezeyi]KAA6474105.1 ATP-binding cassette domain-containing protein [Bacillus swezeyi]TYS33356.1 ABC transporter ATP-binding protein [Bacillus swezeyi]
MISLKNVCFQYNEKQTLLQNIHLQIEQGEFIVLTGPSGSGKTTLSRIINGLIPHFYEGTLSGDVHIKGQNLKAAPIWQISQSIGSVFQDPKTQFFTSVAQDEMAFELENYGRDRSFIQQRLDDVCKQMNIADIRGAFLHTLSSGQKQNVAIASATMIDPEIYVMDEPSANLDLNATDALKDELVRLKKLGKTVVIAEHRLYYVMDLADRIIYMRNGRIEGILNPQETALFSHEELKKRGLRSPSLTEGSLPKNEAQNLPRDAAIDIRQLYVRHKRKNPFTIKGADLSLKFGEVCALIGENGAGKTMLARTITGLIHEHAGEIYFSGKRVKAKQRLKRAWFVMQDTVYQLFADSVWNELFLNIEPSLENKQQAEKLLKMLDLWLLREQHPATLSGGQKQRLVLAVGLMQKADIFILDEPTSGLDGSNLQRVISVIRQLKRRNCHVLIITHDHELVAGACQQIIKLEDGKISQNIPTATLEYEEIIQLMRSNQTIKKEDHTCHHHRLSNAF